MELNSNSAHLKAVGHRDPTLHSRLKAHMLLVMTRVVTFYEFIIVDF